MIDFDYLEFLAWVDRCLLPVDLANDLKDLGMDESTSTFYRMEWTHLREVMGEFTIIKLYQY